jgi:alpha-tubulin suppressor-like RCC1 family protein
MRFRRILAIFGGGVAVLALGWIGLQQMPAKASGVLTDAPVIYGLAAGGAHACGIFNASGTVYCWGSNERGQLGTGDNLDRSRPDTAVDLGGKKAVSIAAGFAHTCAVTDDGGVYCWGANDKGQLGDGTDDDSDAPVLIDGGGLGGAEMARVYAGFSTTCVTTADGWLYCWGSNDEGQYGDGTKNENVAPPSAASQDGIEDMAIGVGHACVIKSGVAFCSGAGGSGQLGNSDFDNSLFLYGVSGIVGEPVAVSAGYFMSCAASDSGFYCWGDDTSGQLGGGGAVDTAVELMSWSDALPVASGYAHSCAGFWCIGENGSGQLGDDSTVNKSVMTSVDLSGVLAGLTVKDVSAGFDFTCWIAGDAGSSLADAAFCSGAGVDGQLGDNALTNSSVPVAVDTSQIAREITYISLSANTSEIKLSVPPGGMDTEDITLTVVTNNDDGYNLFIKADPADLVCETDDSLVISPQSVGGAGAVLETNHWGYGVGTSEPADWYGVTTNNAVVDSSSSATDESGRGTEVWFGAKVDNAFPACKYGGVVVFTGTGV